MAAATTSESLGVEAGSAVKAEGYRRAPPMQCLDETDVEGAHSVSGRDNFDPLQCLQRGWTARRVRSGPKVPMLHRLASVESNGFSGGLWKQKPPPYLPVDGIMRATATTVKMSEQTEQLVAEVAEYVHSQCSRESSLLQFTHSESTREPVVLEVHEAGTSRPAGRSASNVAASIKGLTECEMETMELLEQQSWGEAELSVGSIGVKKVPDRCEDSGSAKALDQASDAGAQSESIPCDSATAKSGGCFAFCSEGNKCSDLDSPKPGIRLALEGAQAVGNPPGACDNGSVGAKSNGAMSRAASCRGGTVAPFEDPAFVVWGASAGSFRIRSDGTEMEADDEKPTIISGAPIAGVSKKRAGAGGKTEYDLRLLSTKQLWDLYRDCVGKKSTKKDKGWLVRRIVDAYRRTGLPLPDIEPEGRFAKRAAISPGGKRSPPPAGKQRRAWESKGLGLQVQTSGLSGGEDMVASSPGIFEGCPSFGSDGAVSERAYSSEEEETGMEVDQPERCDGDGQLGLLCLWQAAAEVEEAAAGSADDQPGDCASVLPDNAEEEAEHLASSACRVTAGVMEDGPGAWGEVKAAMERLRGAGQRPGCYPPDGSAQDGGNEAGLNLERAAESSRKQIGLQGMLSGCLQEAGAPEQVEDVKGDFRAPSQAGQGCTTTVDCCAKLPSCVQLPSADPSVVVKCGTLTEIDKNASCQKWALSVVSPKVRKVEAGDVKPSSCTVDENQGRWPVAGPCVAASMAWSLYREDRPHSLGQWEPEGVGGVPECVGPLCS